MASRKDLMAWVVDALRDAGGEATVLDVAKHIWSANESELKKSNIFYTWQYDMRWAAKKLRDQGILADAGATLRGTWALKK